jgi:hypothetical protein
MGRDTSLAWRAEYCTYPNILGLGAKLFMAKVQVFHVGSSTSARLKSNFSLARLFKSDLAAEGRTRLALSMEGAGAIFSVTYKGHRYPRSLPPDLKRFS